MLIVRGDLLLAGMGAERTVSERAFTHACALWQRCVRLPFVILAGEARSLDIPALSHLYLDQVLLAMDADFEITRADDRISMLNSSRNFEEALQTAQELVTRFPDHPRAHFVLAGTFDFQGREAEAVSPYQRAWELGLSGDDVPRFYVQYGSTLRNVGQFHEAVRVLIEGRERFPKNAAIRAFLALALFSAGRQADALATSLTLLVEYPETVGLQGYERALRHYTAELREPDQAQ